VRIRDSVILVTGGTGFLGGQVSDELSKAGANVVPVGSAQFDLRNRAEARAMLESVRPNAVVHLAAVVGGIGANRAEPGRFLYENAIMGLELIEACRERDVGKVLIAGTVCAYPKSTPVPFSEDALWDGYPEETNAPYGVAKRTLLIQAQAYRQQYGMNIVYLLPVNLYGPLQSFDLETSHVIPAMIRRFIEARNQGAGEVALWGSGNPTREFLHVRDAARAFGLALRDYDGSEPVNVGSGHEIAIRELAEKIADLVGFRGAVVWDTEKPDGQPRRRLDVSRAKTLFGFEAAIPFEEGLKETVAWYESRL
jgi:GDP-L-fucose synthase